MYDSSEIIYGDAMKKFLFAILCTLTFCFVTGCSAEKISTQKIRDIDFTVVDEAKIPEELEEKIDDKEEKPFKLTYADNGALYIAVGYGEQKTSGYSIKVTDLYETENAIYIHTSLIGPAKDEKIVEKKRLELPKQITNVIKCKNPRCITSIEQELPHVFFLADEAKEVYRCLYCEEKFNKKNL